MEHARKALAESPFTCFLELWEGDSAGGAAKVRVESFIRETERSGQGWLTLDSDNSHAHVLEELRQRAPSLPIGSLVFVADTVIEERPPGHYPDLPWDKGNNP